MPKKHRLLAIGECMVELSGDGNPLFKKAFAGDVLNTLWYAKAGFSTDGDCAFCSAVGDDPLSDQMVDFISSAHIDCTDVQRLSGKRPGLYMIHLDGAERSFSYWRGQSAARLLAESRSDLEQAIDKSTAVYFSGITLAILSLEDRQFLIETLRKAKTNGKTVIFDPNIRPLLWENEDVMCSTVSQAAEDCDIILPSHEDEASAFGDQTPVETAQRYTKRDNQIVVVKDGAGDILVSNNRTLEWFATSPVASAVDTTGAGDSFNGAFLSEYLKSKDVTKAVSAGQFCAAQVVCHPGALMPVELISKL